ncbi:MAG: GNAT family N-acetyltransferase [Planctomycetota bacterium]|nr:GNAT family N-acetyltransferase [Planctomycetota bacterium]
MHAPTLTTPNLTLRELDPESTTDVAFLLELVNDPGFREHIAELGITTPEGAIDYMNRACVHFYREHGFGMYGVERRDTGTLIGIMGLLARPILPAPDLGFAFLAEHTGRGFATEAAEAALADCLTRLGIEQVLAVTSESNAASIALLTKLGFHRGGPVRLDPKGPESLLFSRTQRAE